MGIRELFAGALVVVRVSAGHSQFDMFAQRLIRGRCDNRLAGGVKYWLTKFASEKPGLFFCCSYNWTIAVGSAFGVASTNVF